MHSYTYFARHYDALTANIDYAARASYFDGLIRQHGTPSGLFLDLACGTGSLSVEMAKRGYEVIGADASGEMLSVALDKSARAGLDILYLRQPMEDLDLFGTVDNCVCALDSLNHLPNAAALARVFSRVALFLSPGGLFLFDVNTPYKHRVILGSNTFVYELPEVFCVWQNAYAEGEGRVDITLDLFVPEKDGGYSRSREGFSEWAYSRQQIESALAANKFELLAVHADDTTDAPGDATERLIYVTKRREG